jgi:hypothetical protein
MPYIPLQLTQSTVLTSSSQRLLPSQPEPLRNHFGLNHLTEADLEKICRDNYTPYGGAKALIEKRATILDEYNLKSECFAQKRDAAIEKIQKKYSSELSTARKERNNVLESINLQIKESDAKQKQFCPAFNLLKVS